MHKVHGGRYGGRALTTAEAVLAKTTDSRVLGASLLAFGLGWLAQSTRLIDFSMVSVVAGALIVLGVSMVATARAAAASFRLVAVGMALTLGLMVMSAELPSLRGGFGQRMIAPLSASDIPPSYNMFAGQLTIDLTDTVLFESRATDIDVDMVFADLIVLVPEGVTVEVTYQLKMGGEVTILGRRYQGGQIEDGVIDRVEGSKRTIHLDISAWGAQIEVRRAGS